ncbi:hypothetical protein FACS1894182_08490 [Bacteroidia bacterium]|nr:hypothetical protein FACS1894182_08490 [Bacteroidia bacterium]
MENKGNNKEYRLSATVITIVVIMGFILQLVAGNINFDLLHAPVNLFIGGVIILSIIAFAFFKNTFVYQWFSGVSFSITLLAVLLIFCLFMGLIPQAPVTSGPGTEIYTLLGLRQITSSVPFVLLYCTLLLSLGTLIIRRLTGFSFRNITFYLNHIGLWILLFAAGLGAADHKQYTVYVSEGETTSYGYKNNQAYPLPFTIHLYDFDIEEYPLDSIQQLHSVQPEPKSYLSDIAVSWKNKGNIQARIEVNKPLNTGAWAIYQYGYDHKAGKYSTYSILLSVYDPWLLGVYAGICLLAAGAAGMIIRVFGKWWKRRVKTHKLYVSTGVAACIMVMFAIFLLLYPQIRSAHLMPALQSHWFIPHVAAYILSYALMGAATIASFFQLRKYKKNGVPNENLYKLIDKLVSVGFGLLMLGMLMGAVWAKEAWGHYWSWDPKETWAFITVVTYLLYIHLRIQQRRQVYALYLLPLAFLLLMVAWIGVNYLPSAQHSIHVY